MSITKLTFKKTKTELNNIECAIQFLGKKSIDHYLRSEIPKMIKKISEQPVDIERKYKEHILSEETHAALMELSQKLQKPATKIVDEFLLIPLQNKV